jgi:hypothetical protein
VRTLVLFCCSSLTSLSFFSILSLSCRDPPMLSCCTCTYQRAAAAHCCFVVGTHCGPRPHTLSHLFYPIQSYLITLITLILTRCAILFAYVCLWLPILESDIRSTPVQSSCFLNPVLPRSDPYIGLRHIGPTMSHVHVRDFVSLEKM